MQHAIAGIVAAACFLVFGRGLLPSYRDVWVAAIALFCYALVVLPLNFLLGTNYGFLARKPEIGSLLDYLGPWPWYIASIEGIAIVAFHLFYLPVLLLRRRAPASNP